ncbi:MAG: 3-methyl-2-oxobutanoate hydroxymethyltransferase [Myxococcales bacterium]|nr:MAG: 3-methyl-2-oxobutanoate hydroxymethyltransferase [Myxococcales bacterium]
MNQPATKAKQNSRLGAPELSQRKNNTRITMVTAYDATFARIFDDAGVDALLVGDSLGMVIQGHPNTLAVSIDEIIYHCKAVARGSYRAHLVADLPFMSYHLSTEQTLRNAGRCLSEGQAQAVKLEGGLRSAKTVEALVNAGIPVMGHVGLTPQSVHRYGGFRVQGRDPKEADSIIQDAKAIQDAGAYALVIEAVPEDLAQAITESLDIPTIGIGASPTCDGQVLVGYDLLGLSPDPAPRFVKHYSNFFEQGIKATARFIDDVQHGRFPEMEHTYEKNKKEPSEPSPSKPNLHIVSDT